MAAETGHFKCQHPRIIPHFERILSDLIWLVVEPPAHLKNIDQVSWDDEIPNTVYNIYVYGKNKIHVPNHQPIIILTQGPIKVGFISAPKSAEMLKQIALLGLFAMFSHYALAYGTMER